jgi:multiple sugar transport system permease protein
MTDTIGRGAGPVVTGPVGTSAPEPAPSFRPSRAPSHWRVYAVMSAGLLLVTAPFLWMLLGSVKSESELRRIPPTWWPERFTLENYRELFSRLDFPIYFFNSVLVALLITLGNIVFCSMLGYALAKLEFRGRRVLFGLVIGMLMVPGMVIFVPQYVLVANLGLVNTYWGLVLPFLAGPFGVFLMRQFMSAIPDELLDAARVDGAGEARIFRSIVMPLMGPGVATLGILTFLASWNNFLWPLVVAQTEDMYTLPVALALVSVDQNQTNYGLLLGGAVVVIVPIVAVFVALQRYFVQGIAMTGLKS